MQNLNETTYLKQDQFRAKESVKGTEKSYIVGVNGAVTESPTATRTALPCLSNNNSTISIESEAEKITSAQYKSVWGLRENIKSWCAELGMENMAFLTITVVENITCKKEYARRYKSFYNYLMESGIETILCKADEPQSRGAWHSHCITEMGEDVRTGFDFQAYKMSNQLAQVMRDENRSKGGLPKDWLKNSNKVIRKQYEDAKKRYTRSSGAKLRRAWKIIRDGAKASGFGRCELIPIQHAKACADYVGKYLSKGFASKSPQTKGMRKINYCRGVRRKVGSNFSWARGGSLEWRKNLKASASYHGIPEDRTGKRDFQAFERIYGDRWAYKNADEITYIGRRERWLHAQGGEDWDRWKKIQARSDYDDMHKDGNIREEVRVAWHLIDNANMRPEADELVVRLNSGDPF